MKAAITSSNASPCGARVGTVSANTVVFFVTQSEELPSADYELLRRKKIATAKPITKKRRSENGSRSKISGCA